MVNVLQSMSELCRMKNFPIKCVNRDPTEKHCILRRVLEEETITSNLVDILGSRFV